MATFYEFIVHECNILTDALFNDDTSAVIISRQICFQRCVPASMRSGMQNGSFGAGNHTPKTVQSWSDGMR